MSKTAMLSLLDSASNGADILSILDTLTAENVSVEGYNEPTADSIEF